MTTTRIKAEPAKYNLSMLPSLNKEKDILGYEMLNEEVSEKEYKTAIVATIPDEYKKAKFSNLFEGAQTGLLRTINEVESFKLGFYFTGAPGAGKTYAGWSVYKLLNFSTIPCYMIDCDTLLDNIQNANFNRPSLFTLEDVENYKGFLIIDDLGARGETAWTNNVIRRIISRRFDWHRKTGFTSNLSIKEISEKFDDRIASRIAGFCDIYTFMSNDKRI